MAVYVLSDPHLSFSSDKPMDIFGNRWENHTQRIAENWQATVKNNDTVIIPGDISWGMSIDEAASDLEFINRLNGKKIIGKGNHDYWWQTMKKLEKFKSELCLNSISFLYNNAYVCEGLIICGTRSWFTDTAYSPEDEKIVCRESGRLELSIAEALKLKEQYPQNEIVVFLHYPPAYNGVTNKSVAQILEKYRIKRCFYGHLHGVNSALLCGSVGETRLFCASADYIGFKPLIVGQDKL